MALALPILAKASDIVSALARHQALVVCGATGSGKTTQLPQLLLRAGLGRGIIGHTQPRRIAARSVAQRIASEMGTSLGDVVGVQVRFDDQTSPRTRIKLMTDGIALAELIGDPLLRRYDAMIVDEAHERSLNIDLLLASLRLILRKRPEFRVVITSATIDPARFSDYFGGGDACPVIEVSGRSFPIRTIYSPPSSCADGELANPQEIADAVHEARAALARAGPGTPQDVLVFVPGEREIRAASAAIASSVRGGSLRGCEVLPLFARLSSAEQDRVFAKGDQPRVIVATNVAETSLTLPAIGAVVDTGVARISRYDPRRRVGTLPTEPVSRASCDQRSGRCGRVAPGVCVRLYSEASYASRDALTPPEVLRTNLAGLVLRMRTLPAPMLEAPCDASGLPVALMQPPSAASVDEAYTSLFELSAIDAPSRDGAITPMGRAIARMPVDPRVARMLLAARELACAGDVLILAAGLSLQDPRERPQGKQDEADRAHTMFRHATSDFLSLLKLYDQFDHAAREGKDDAFVGSAAQWCRNHFVNAARMREWRELVWQLRDALAEAGEELEGPGEPGASDDALHNLAMPRDEAIHRALLTGLVATVACREGDAGSGVYRTVRGEQARIFPGSTLFRSAPQWLMAAEIVQTSQLFARTCARIDPAWVQQQAAHLFRTQLSDAHVSEGQPSAWRRVTLGSIVVVPRERVPLAQHDTRLAREVFCTQVLARPEGIAAANPTTGLASFGFMQHNASLLATAQRAQAKLRRKDVLAPPERRAAFFLQRVPLDVCDEASLLSALARDAALDSALRLAEHDCLAPGSTRALDASEFLDSIALGSGSGPRVLAHVAYAFSPGKDEDGLTFSLPLLALPLMDDSRVAWLVPGMRAELLTALLKQAPKGVRAAIERACTEQGLPAGNTGLDKLGEQLAQLVDSEPAQGPAETLASLLRDVLGVECAANQFALQGLPLHLRPRLCVEDAAGEELASGRDIGQLRQRLAAKLAVAQREQASQQHDREGLQTWEEWTLPDATDRAAHASSEGLLVLLDEGDSVRLSRGHDGLSVGGALALSRLGVRRLLALQHADELEHALASCPGLDVMQKQYAALGSAADLRDALAILTIDKALLTQRPLPRTRAEFEERVQEGQGKLMLAMREVCDCVGKVLEARARVAQRLASGTNRNWAASIADMREHAAYLLPEGFLAVVAWQRARDYSRYATTLRERLFALREDGSGVEKEALALVQPRWKLLTAGVARAMSDEKKRLEAKPEGAAAPQGKDVLLRGQAPRHAAKRGAPVVNVDAGAWALRPEHAWRFDDARTALEELRAAVFGGLSQQAGVPLAVRHAALVQRAENALASMAALLQAER